MKYPMSEITELIKEADRTPLASLGRKQSNYLKAISKLLYNIVSNQKEAHNAKTKRKRT